MNAITKYLAGVLTVIALGISVIAYNLVIPRTEPSAAYVDRWTKTDVLPVNAVRDEAGPVASPRAYRVAEEPMVVQSAYPVRAVEVESTPRRVVTRNVESAPRRDWKRTAMVIGGSTAAGAGIGGIFAGRKGALIGAAIAGGVSTIHQTR